MLLMVVILLALFGGGGYAAYRFLMPKDSAATNAPLLQSVIRGPFDHIVLDQGEVESSSNIDVLCEVKTRGGSGTPILWVIDEGTYVKKGDKLVELDSSALETELQTQRILVASAEATVISSKAAVRTAEIGLQEYILGTYQTERRTILSEIATAEQELRKMELNLASAERLAAKGMVKSLQIEAETFAVSNAKNMLESATGRLKVLDELTQEKMKVQLESAIDAAKAKLSSDESVLNEELNKLRDAEDQVAKCIILSPTDGVVVHNNAFSSRGGSAEFVVEAGASLRERQCVIKLPDPNRMQVKAKINESSITLIREGMPVKISISAAQNELTGRVRRVNKYAEPGSWFSSSVKEYAALIEILNPPETIRTGMTAEVRIFVEQLDDALQIPVQGIYEYQGHHFCLKLAGDKWETVEIKIGATNDKMVTVEEGLAENDRFALNPRSHLDLLKLPEIEDVQDRDELIELAKQPPLPPTAGDSTGGGVPFSPEAMADKTLASSDTDKDGKLSSTEIDAIDERFRDRVKQSDTNRDGSVDRSELVASGKKRAAQAAGAGGPPGAGGGRGAGGAAGGSGSGRPTGQPAN